MPQPHEATTVAFTRWLPWSRCALDGPMTPEQRAALEQRAERSIRRGDLGDALEMLRAVSRAYPGDQALEQRLTLIEGSLQPEELVNANATWHSEPSGLAATPAQRAEALASRGDFASAVAIYRELAQAQPASELIRERLAELFQLAQAKTHRPSLDKQHLLEHLLDRIAARRR